MARPKNELAAGISMIGTQIASNWGQLITPVWLGGE
jgi:hypothetical protein